MAAACEKTNIYLILAQVIISVGGTSDSAFYTRNCAVNVTPGARRKIRAMKSSNDFYGRGVLRWTIHMPFERFWRATRN